MESYAGQAEVDRDCPGEEFSAEAWSNPVGDDVMLDNSTGIDCLRWCYFTETCFAVVVRDHKCYLRNDKCFSNLRDAPGAVLGGGYLHTYGIMHEYSFFRMMNNVTTCFIIRAPLVYKE